MKMKKILFAGLVGALVATSAQAQEWTRFRGPNGTGVSTAKTIPIQFAEKDYNWKVALPGDGHSSPVIWGDKIFLTGSHEQQGGMVVHAISVHDGRVLWQKDFPFPAFAKHKFNSYASSTAAVDAERVYVAWATPEHYMLVAFSHKGDIVWQRDFGPFVSQHGVGVSPMVYQEMVILPNDQDGNSSLIAVDRKTGKTVWETKRNSSAAAYGTPCVYEPKGGKPQLIFNSQAHGITGVDPTNGKVLWEYDKAFNKRSVSSPVIVAGLAIGSCGSGGGGNYIVAVKPGDDAKKQPATLAWEMKKSANYVPTPVVVGDNLYAWSDGGIVTCINGPTGEIKWQERAGGNFFGSPIVVDGRIYAISTSGEVVVIKATPEKFEVMGRSALGELTHTTPAVAGGKMYIRTLKHLICVGGSKMDPLKAVN